MYKLCKTEQSALRQRQIEDALLEMMLQYRYDAISISDLCGGLGIPRKAFYRYFDSKDGCLHALLDHRLMEYEQKAEPVKFDQTLGVEVDFPYYFAFWQTQERLLTALERSNLGGILVQRAINYYQNVQYPDVVSYETFEEYNHYVTSFVVTGLMTMVLQWHQGGYQKSPEEMARIAQRMMSRPLLSIS